MCCVYEECADKETCPYSLGQAGLEQGVAYDLALQKQLVQEEVLETGQEDHEEDGGY